MALFFLFNKFSARALYLATHAKLLISCSILSAQKETSVKKTDKPAVLKNYGFSLLLIGSVLIGALIGILFQKSATALKPLGDIFLNLLFTAVVPLVFFSISSAVAGMSDLRRLGRILLWMVLIFIGTGILSSSLMVIGVKLYPPVISANPLISLTADVAQVKTAEQIVRAFTVPDFSELLTKKNMMALIVFSLLIGLATSSAREKGKLFADFLASGNAVMMKVISYIMLYAPVGLASYFAYLVGTFGSELLRSYLRVITLYYPLSISYFFIGYTFYAALAGGMKGIRTFWSKILPPSVTALEIGRASCRERV